LKIETVGIVGCGLMGSGITEMAARCGYRVIVSEADEGLLSRGLDRIRASLTRAVSQGKATHGEMDDALMRIRGTTRLEEFGACHLVVEAVTEDMALKKEVFATLDYICPPHTILGSNTSCLCVTEMASVTRRGDRVLGLHFFNPVPVMKLLEIVRTILTSDETLETGRAFGESLGKTVVVAPDRPGFIVSRLLIPYLLNAIRAVGNSVASVEDIDQAMQLGTNQPMGPLELSDLVGLDTMLNIATQMFGEFKDPVYAAPPLLRRMVLAGHLGRKTGKGFYSYQCQADVRTPGSGRVEPGTRIRT
jgi:3-hydroxybutyryl-CoA dehydrogenase